MGNADKVIAVSYFTLDLIFNGMVDPVKIKVVHNAVNREKNYARNYKYILIKR